MAGDGAATAHTLSNVDDAALEYWSAAIAQAADGDPSSPLCVGGRRRYSRTNACAAGGGGGGAAGPSSSVESSNAVGEAVMEEEEK